MVVGSGLHYGATSYHWTCVALADSIAISMIYVAAAIAAASAVMAVMGPNKTATVQGIQTGKYMIAHGNR